MISTHASPLHAINLQHQFHKENNYVCTAYSDNQVKLFSMLQDMHTNHPQQKYVNISINPYHKKSKCTKSIIIIIFIKKQEQEFKTPVTDHHAGYPDLECHTHL